MINKPELDYDDTSKQWIANYPLELATKGTGGVNAYFKIKKVFNGEIVVSSSNDQSLPNFAYLFLILRLMNNQFPDGDCDQDGFDILSDKIKECSKG